MPEPRATQYNENHDERGRFARIMASGPLTSDERYALELYVVGGVKGYGHRVDYEAINGALRTGAFEQGGAPEHIVEVVDALDRVFEKDSVTLTEPTTVYRGMPTSKIAVGDVIIDRGYVSTSRDRERTKVFSQGRPYKGTATIRLPAGTRVVDVAWRLGRAGRQGRAERELLLSRGSRFRVTSVTSSRRYAKVELELLPRADNFDPDQPRDESGRWTSDGGGFADVAPKTNDDLARSRAVGELVNAKNKECYKNSCMAVASTAVPTGSVYVEGYATSDGLPMPIAHGWIETPDGSIIDPTPVWHEKSDAKYFGARRYTREQIWERVSSGRGNNLPFDRALGMGSPRGKSAAAYRSAWASIMGPDGAAVLFGISEGEFTRGQARIMAAADNSMLGRARVAVQQAIVALAGGPLADMRRWLAQLFGEAAATELMAGVTASDLAPYVSYPAEVGEADLVLAGQFNENHDERGRFARSAAKVTLIGGLEFSTQDAPLGEPAGRGQRIDPARVVGGSGVKAPEAIRLKDGTVYIGEGHYQILRDAFRAGYTQSDVRSYGYYHKATSELFLLHRREAPHAAAMLRSAWSDAQSAGQGFSALDFNPEHDELGRFAPTSGPARGRTAADKKRFREQLEGGADAKWADGQYTGEVPAGGFKKSPGMTFTDLERNAGVFEFDAQARQYPSKGPAGLSYFKGEISETVYVDCLLYRDEAGKVIGVLNHYPQDIRQRGWPTPIERKGNVTMMVSPAHQRRGIGTALLREAGARWNVNLAQQKFTTAGAAFANAVSKPRSAR